ncbi:hypothetical protein [Variovorax paradoxus]|uniref:hypothetical protein n=1 Tax=Variovorax paradoxus TaxID=34073 RepID=UPI0029C8090D|nr:hypothetical protein RZE77_14345 [Variovorax paradoxus]
MEHQTRLREAVRNALSEKQQCLLMASAWVRVAGALMLAAALWLAVGWALK